MVAAGSTLALFVIAHKWIVRARMFKTYLRSMVFVLAFDCLKDRIIFQYWQFFRNFRIEWLFLMHRVFGVQL